jgi:predicted nuclease of predicted toxin-antitoxin system
LGKFLANENVPRVAVDALRGAGHDVAWIRTDAPGLADAVVLKRASAEGRVLVTFDKGFGELVFAAGARASHGVVLLRINCDDPESTARRVVHSIGLREDWSRHFSVVDDARIRMVPLEGSGGA